jgi:hypothetical protein
LLVVGLRPVPFLGAAVVEAPVSYAFLAFLSSKAYALLLMSNLDKGFTEAFCPSSLFAAANTSI